jgi:hypothetical protein
MAIEGSYRTFTTPDGAAIPWYVIPFDESGRCKAPVTRKYLLDTLASETFSHVFLFSHGWNNDWADATERYESFIQGFGAMVDRQGLSKTPGYRPLLVGVFWPGISLVLPWERAPQFAGAGAAPGAADADRFADEHDRSVTTLAAQLPAADVPRFYELANSKELTVTQAEALAALVLPLLAPSDEGGGEPLGAADLVAAWKLAAVETSAAAGAALDVPDDESFGVSAPVAGGGPQAASWLGALDPRNALRMATVWQMKDRAGTVGAGGVHELLIDILGANKGHVHLVGHSYGAKVMLSACAAGKLPRAVTSVLLLQPAVSYLCFAVDADGKQHPGGYRGVLDPTCATQPVLATFSSNDVALARLFHFAVRRKSDVGEQRIAAGPPSRFAALGGYGAGGLAAGEGRQVGARQEGETYGDVGAGVRVVSVEGSDRISGHGDVSNLTTWWMLCDQVRRGS